MLARRSFLLAAAPALLVAKPALATAVCTLSEAPASSALPLLPVGRGDDFPMLYSAWSQFCDAADAITAGSHGWQIRGGRRAEEHFAHLARIDLEMGQDGVPRPVERHSAITLWRVQLSDPAHLGRRA